MRQTKIYVPAASSLEERTPEWRHNGQYQLIARLAPNATIAMARAQIASLNAEQLQDKRDPFIPLIKASGGFFTIVSGLQEDQVETVKPILLLLQSAVLLLLLMGWVNLISLLLIRAVQRSASATASASPRLPSPSFCQPAHGCFSSA